jgi:hypothetical protein
MKRKTLQQQVTELEARVKELEVKIFILETSRRRLGPQTDPSPYDPYNSPKPWVTPDPYDPLKGWRPHQPFWCAKTGY